MVVTPHGSLRIGDGCAVSFVAMAIATVAASLGGAINARAAEPPAFTMQQVTAGEVVYDRNCARCHGSSLNGGQFGPALIGDNFSAHWRGKNLANYFAKVEAMPFGRPASVPGPRCLSDHGIAPIDCRRPPHIEESRNADGG